MRPSIHFIGSRFGWSSGKLVAEYGAHALRDDGGLPAALKTIGVDAEWQTIIDLPSIPTIADRLGGTLPPTARERGDDLAATQVQQNKITRAELLRWATDQSIALRDAVAHAPPACLPMVIGGDHITAIGLYAGLKQRLPDGAKAGVVWVDAHADMNNFATSPYGSMHGMSLAVALGYGDKESLLDVAAGSCLSLAHCVLVGARDLDAGEVDFIARHNIKHFTMADIQARGFQAVFDDAVHIASTGTAGYGLTIDVDALDPTDFTATGTTVAGGIAYDDLITALQNIKCAPLVAELVEYDPPSDKDNACLHRARDIIVALGSGLCRLAK